MDDYLLSGILGIDDVFLIPPIVVKVWLNQAMLYMILINVIKIVTLQSFSCSCKDKSVLEDLRQ